MKTKVTINDIARQSRVSVSAVSLVLNNKPGVSDDTRSRVLETARELGYKIKTPEPQPKNGHLQTIGMLVKVDPDITPQANPFYSKVIVGIEDACRRKKINLLFATLPVDDNNRPAEIPALLYNDSVDGLLLVGTCVDESFSVVSDSQNMPIVLVDGYSDTESYDSIISDNFRAAYQAVEYLIHKGHRRIGLLGSTENSFPSIRDRRNGYLRALKENNIGEPYIASFNINKSKGFEETERLLKDHPEITALFCVNDDVGSAAIRTAQSLGKRVPQDISIIGYDDTYIAANTHPPLTTMHVDTVTLGRAAVHLLSLRIEYPESARITMDIHPKMVERETVSEARARSEK